MVLADDGDHPWKVGGTGATRHGSAHAPQQRDCIRSARRWTPIIPIHRLGDPPDADLADDWCKGYTLAFALREDEWQEAMDAPELREAFQPILAIARPKTSPGFICRESQRMPRMVHRLPDCATQIYDWWRKKLFASPPPAADRAHRSQHHSPRGPEDFAQRVLPMRKRKKVQALLFGTAHSLSPGRVAGALLPAKPPRFPEARER